MQLRDAWVGLLAGDQSCVGHPFANNWLLEKSEYDLVIFK
jgi:hypothetical protein